jgi:small subunit ribosomal protein S8
MSAISDPISDMLVRIRNGIMAGHTTVAMPSSKMKMSIAEILKAEGYIEDYEAVEGEKPSHKILRVRLKYMGERKTRRPVIEGLERISRPGRRIYAKKSEIPWVLSGLGIVILSTSKGVMTGQRARQIGQGGEVLCKVW